MPDAIVLMGCRTDHLPMEEALVRVGELIRSGQPHQRVAENVGKLVKASRDPGLCCMRPAFDAADWPGVV